MFRLLLTSSRRIATSALAASSLVLLVTSSSKAAPPDNSERFDAYHIGSVIGQRDQDKYQNTLTWEKGRWDLPDQPEHQIVQDPTDSGRGKVLRISANHDPNNFASTSSFLRFQQDLFHNKFSIEWDMYRTDARQSIDIHTASDYESIPDGYWRYWGSVAVGRGFPDGGLYGWPWLLENFVPAAIGQWQHYALILDFDARTVVPSVDGVNGDPWDIDFFFFGTCENKLSGIGFTTCIGSDQTQYGPAYIDNLRVVDDDGNDLIAMPRQWEDPLRPAMDWQPRPVDSTTMGEVDLTTLQMVADDGPDIIVFNKWGPDAAYARTYSGALAIRGIGSPGLSPGWTDNYDFVIHGPKGQWGPLTFTAPDGSQETLIPEMNGDVPSGILDVQEQMPPHFFTGTPGSTPGWWTSIVMTETDGTRLEFEAPDPQTTSDGTYLLRKVMDHAGRFYLIRRHPDWRLQSVVAMNGATEYPLLGFDYSMEPGTYNRLKKVTDLVEEDGLPDSAQPAVTYTFDTEQGVPLFSSVSQANSSDLKAEYGYLPISVLRDGVQVTTYALNSLGVPSPTGSGTSAATATYEDGHIAAVTDANSRTHAYLAVPTWIMLDMKLVLVSGITFVTLKGADDSVKDRWFSYWDAKRRDLGTADRYGRRSRIAYSGDTFQPLTVTDPNARQTRFDFTDGTDKQPTAVYAPGRGKVSLTWDYSDGIRFGRLKKQEIASTSASLLPINTDYYEDPVLDNPRLLQSRLATTASGAVDIVYDGNRNPSEVTENGSTQVTPNGSTLGPVLSTYTYGTFPLKGLPDSFSRGTGSTIETASYEYNARGQVKKVTDGLGNETDYEYDETNPYHQLKKVVYPARAVGSGRATVSYTYVYAGGPVKTETAVGDDGLESHTTVYTYGAEGELIKSVTDVGMLSYSEVSHEYDDLYRITKLTEIGGPNNETHITNFIYDDTTANGAVTIQYPGGGSETRTLSYDGNNPVMTVTRPDGTNVRYVYAGLDSEMTDVDYPGTDLDVLYTYNDLGLVETADDSTCLQVYDYDDHGRLESVSTTYTDPDTHADLPMHSVSNTYNPDGSRYQMTLSAAGSSYTFTYLYDTAGRLAKLTNPFNEETLWNYDDASQVVTQILENGASTTYQHNGTGELAQLANSSAAPSLITKFVGVTSDSSDMERDGFGRLEAMRAVGHFPGLNSFSYNTRGELTRDRSTRDSGSCFPNGYDWTFDYDAFSNPTKFPAIRFDSGTYPWGTPINPEGLTYDNNNQRTGSGYVYNGNGNATTNRGLNGLSYDAANRLTAVAPPDGTAMFRAGYRGDGLRAWKNAGGNTPKTWYIYDGDTPICEVDGAGNLLAVNTFGAAGLVSRRSGNASVFYTFDPLGNVAERLDAAGAVLSTSQFDAYGRQYRGVLTDPYGYGGQFGNYTDAETGHVLMTYRYYDPATGRFLTRDPIGYAGGTNLYSYCGGDPVNYADPDGLDWSPRTYRVVATASNVAAGWGDALTLGGTNQIRQSLGTNNAVNKRATSYKAGVGIGFGHSLAFGATKAGGAVIAKGVGTMGGGVSAIKAARAAKAASAARAANAARMAEVARKGRTFEQLVLADIGQAKNTQRLATVLGGAKYRVPDIFDDTARLIGEIKNVKSLRYTKQLRDYAAIARTKGFRFELYVRQGTAIHRDLQAAMKAGHLRIIEVAPK